MDFNTTSSRTELIELIRFILHVDKVLIECGCSSGRVMHVNTILGKNFGVSLETIALPTAVWVSARTVTESITEMVGISTWTIDLDRLDRINQLLESSRFHPKTLSEARSYFDRCLDTEAPYPYWLNCLAGGIASSALVYFYEGNLTEIIAVFPAGIAVQCLQGILSLGNKRFLIEFVCASFVAAYTSILHVWFPNIDDMRIITGGILVLLPGLIFANAVLEVAQKNLVSGAAKMFEAAITTISLGLGVFFTLSIIELFKDWFL